jgi:murein DD-endopeptidase MepM/ murein hydrolase activator NlpD
LRASTVASQQATTTSQRQAAKFSIGDRVMPNDGSVNVRNGATENGALLGTLTGQTIAQITDGPFFDRNGEDWYYVVADSVQGFAIGRLLSPAAAVASQQAPAPTGPTGTFIYPLEKYTFTQGYGCSNLGFYAYNADWGCPLHNGIDLAAPSYTPILASDGGRVTVAGWCDCGLGYYVKIDHGNGFVTTYGHMAEMPYVRVGQQVNQGDVIGPIGSTGLSTGPHVHFMIELNGSTVNPLDYL